MNTIKLKLASSASLVLSSLLLVLAVAPGVASAHAEVKSSNPANGATVNIGVTRLALTFTEDISPDQSSAQLVGPGGPMTQGVTAAVDRADRTMMNIATPPLEAGQYTIKWVAVTEDDNGHTNGELTFTVASGSAPSGSASGTTSGATSAPGGNDSLPATGSGDAPFFTTLLLGFAAALSVLGIALRRRATAQDHN